MAALEAEPRAKAFFATINASNRYAVLWRIQTAVKPETRARRIAQLVEMLARGELKRRRGRYGVETMCIGGGQGMAALFERA